MTPFDWQLPNIAAMVKAVKEHGFCADTSGTGAGKTVMTCLAAKALGRALTVICPKSVIPSWKETAEACEVPLRVSNYEKVLAVANNCKKRFAELSAADFDAMFGAWRRRPARPKAREGVKTKPKARGGTWVWFVRKGSLLVFDEAHRLTSHNSQLAKFLKSAKDGKIPTICLSATLADSPLKMRALGYAMDLCAYEWEQWRAWCLVNGCTLNDFNQLQFTGDESHIDVIRQAMGDRVTGISTGEVPGFPANNVYTKLVPCTEDLEDAYAEALNLMEEEAETEAIASLHARQLSEWGKRMAVLEMAQDAEKEGNNVVIFVNYVETGKWLADKLKVRFIFGQTHAWDRQDAIRKFQQNETNFFVTTLNDGISLHDINGRPRVAIVSPTFVATHFIQRLGRICRTGALSPAVQTIVYAEDSEVEARLKRAVEKKLKNIEKLTDNDLTIMPALKKKAEPDKVIGDHDKRKHASISPSTLKNRANCPHWENRESDPHPLTEAGTRIHEAFERGDTEGLNEEEAELAQLCLDYVDDVLGETGLNGRKRVWTKEHEMLLHTHEKETWGYADLVCRDGVDVHMFDPKTGNNPQDDAEVNLQMIAYVIGIFNFYEGVERVHVHLIYPRLEEVSVATFEEDRLPELMAEVSTIVENVKRARAGEALHNYHRETCKYCKLRDTGCPKWEGVREAMAEEVSNGADVPMPTTFVLDDIKDPEEMGKLLDVLPVLDQFVKDAKQFALCLIMEDGEEIPGWRMITSRGKLSVQDHRLARQLALQKGLSDDEISTCAKLSGPQLAKIVASKAEKGKGAAERAFRELLIDRGAADEGNEFYSLRSVKI